VFLECRLEVLKVSLVGELDAKVVDNETECDGSPHSVGIGSNRSWRASAPEADWQGLLLGEGHTYPCELRYTHLSAVTMSRKLYATMIFLGMMSK
jgi:hypothetical protein